jgi:hypothetical protein
LIPIARSTARYQARGQRCDRDDLSRALEELAQRHPRYGYQQNSDSTLEQAGQSEPPNAAAPATDAPPHPQDKPQSQQ